MNTRMFKTGDKIIIAAIIAIAAIFMVWHTVGVSHDQQLTAIVTKKGKVVKQIQLNELREPETIYLNNEFHQVIRAEKGKIRFLESDCPNQICVQTGWLTKSGDSAVCLPSKVVLTIVGDNEQVDIFSY